MNNTIIIQTTNQKQSEKMLKWKRFGKLKIKTYPHPTLNFLNGVINPPDLTSCSLEEIRLHLKPPGITDVRRISITKETRTIDTNTYILSFNKLITPTSIRIGYINTKIGTYIPNPLRCQKCQKYGHPICAKCAKIWTSICAKCGNSNRAELECKNPFNCINCIGEHSVYSWECGKKNYRNEIHKKHLIPWGLKNRTNTRTTQLCICNKKRKWGKGRHKTKTRRTEQTD